MKLAKIRVVLVVGLFDEASTLEYTGITFKKIIEENVKVEEVVGTENFASVDAVVLSNLSPFQKRRAEEIARKANSNILVFATYDLTGLRERLRELLPKELSDKERGRGKPNKEKKNKSAPVTVPVQSTP